MENYNIILRFQSNETTSSFPCLASQPTPFPISRERKRSGQRGWGFIYGPHKQANEINICICCIVFVDASNIYWFMRSTSVIIVFERGAFIKY